MSGSQGIARSITKFTTSEVTELFKHARTKMRVDGLEIRLAPIRLGPKEYDFGRILIVTPKRSGNAVQRNRIRRRLKSIFYEQQLYTLGYDCIVLVGRQAIGLPFEELKKHLTSAFKNP